MTRELRLHPDADRELNDTVDYYERERLGLGAVFIAEVEDGFDRISMDPRERT